MGDAADDRLDDNLADLTGAPPRRRHAHPRPPAVRPGGGLPRRHEDPDHPRLLPVAAAPLPAGSRPRPAVRRDGRAHRRRAAGGGPRHRPGPLPLRGRQRTRQGGDPPDPRHPAGRLRRYPEVDRDGARPHPPHHRPPRRPARHHRRRLRPAEGAARRRRDRNPQQACHDGAFDVPGLRDACRALSSGSNTDQERGTGIQAWLDAAESRIERFHEFVKHFLTDRGRPPQDPADQEARDIQPGGPPMPDGRGRAPVPDHRPGQVGRSRQLHLRPADPGRSADRDLHPAQGRPLPAGL